MPCKLGITSMSLGHAAAGHSLTHKLDMAQKYGYQGVELFYADLLDHANQFETTSPTLSSDNTPSHTAQLAAARDVRQLCAARGITIICLQPFTHYEGLVDRSAHEEHIAKLHQWIELAHELGTDIIQVPSSFLPAPQVSDDMGLIVSDLQKIADIGAAANPPLRFVYEALCWGTRVDLWETSWSVVKRVDRPNFGLCLDSFNIAGRIYADPASPEGKTVNAEEVVRQSMERLVRDVDVTRVFYVQIVDAERLLSPLVEGHAFYNPEQPTRMSWSRNCRLFYGEKEHGAYLPIKEIAEAFFNKLGFEGWVSLELFNRRMNDTDRDVPQELAQRGAVSWGKLVQDLGLRTETTTSTTTTSHAPTRASRTGKAKAKGLPALALL